MVTTIQYLNDLEVKGTLPDLINRGVVGANVVMEIHIYNFYASKLSTGWLKKNAIAETIKQFKIKPRKLYRTIEKMEAMQK